MLDLILSELEKDGYFKDVTTEIYPELNGDTEAHVFAREDGIFAFESLLDTFRGALPELKFELAIKNGAQFRRESSLFSVRGPARNILSAERTLLNFFSLTCGVATLTKMFVDEVHPYPTKILCTRKTIPLLRDVQHQSVIAGGGFLHRRSLSDGILIKDNHLQFVQMTSAIERAKKRRSPLHRIEIEVSTISELFHALKGKPDIIMLDNFSIPQIREAQTIIGCQSEIEVSGGITLENVRNIAGLGVPYISVGALTHSARWLNLSLEFPS